MCVAGLALRITGLTRQPLRCPRRPGWVRPASRDGAAGQPGWVRPASRDGAAGQPGRSGLECRDVVALVGLLPERAKESASSRWGMSGPSQLGITLRTVPVTLRRIRPLAGSPHSANEAGEAADDRENVLARLYDPFRRPRAPSD